MLAEADDLAGSNHERVTGVQRPLAVAEADAAAALLEIGEYEELMRMGVIAGGVSGRQLLVTEDFSFQAPLQATTGRSALRKIVAHAAANVRGHRVLHQWQDGDEVCTIYQLSVETGGEATSVLVSEWSTVRGGHLAASLMVFDTGPFRGAATRRGPSLIRSGA